MKNDLTIYDAVRDEMKTGDLLQWRSRSLIGAMIRLRTQAKRPAYETERGINVNHSSLVVRLGEYEGLERRRFTTEALEHGTVLNLLSRRLESFDGEVWWYPLNDELNPGRTLYGERALELIGIPYDYGSIVRQIVGKVSSNARELFCSEYCFMVWGFAGKALTPNEIPELGIFKTPVRIL